MKSKIDPRTKVEADERRKLESAALNEATKDLFEKFPNLNEECFEEANAYFHRRHAHHKSILFGDDGDAVGAMMGRNK